MSNVVESARIFLALPMTAGGWLPCVPRGTSYPLEKGGDAMVTYDGLFAFCLVIIGIISLFFQAKKK